MKRTGEVRVYDAGVSVWEEPHFPNRRGISCIDDEAMGVVFKRLVGRLAHRGWRVARDPSIEDHYPSLGPRHRVGQLGELGFKGSVHGRSVEFKFFQPSRRVHSSAEYDSRRLLLMDREQRLRALVAMTSLVRKALDMGYVPSARLQLRIDRAPTLQLAIRNIAEERDFDDPLDRFNDRWVPTRFKRDESGWPTLDEYGNGGRNVDADGVPLRNGMTRYLRDPRRTAGRLIRGVVYTNMNCMWMVDTGVGRRWVHGRDLFSCARPDLEPRRLVPHQAQRLETELDRALGDKDFGRVARLARARLALAGERAAE